MKKTPLIALGTWSWGAGAGGGDQVFGNDLTAENLKPVFDLAIQSGLNLFDTALVYGMGSSEKILGVLVKQYAREDLILSTKFTPQLAPKTANPMEEILNQSLANLQTDYIDFYWIHNPTDAPQWVSGLIPLLKSGKVKNVGVSNHNLKQIKEANAILAKYGFKISAVQNHYSLLYRYSEEAGIIDFCKENNIIFFSYMVLEQGALSGKYNALNPLPESSGRGKSYNPMFSQLEVLIEALKKMGDGKNATVAQIAIAWAIAKNTLPIIGVTQVKQVEEAVNASKIILTSQEISDIEVLAAKVDVDTRGWWEKR
ncbi:Predicted oxidoreductase [Chitinophaga costaii]|uniref:Predicted oxidoreductase n=1 Tax=Chitinophaga costaii TaxID=1335309 RepID=A0A1C3YQZ9_9BACT|nr:aldo/keto reductase [Chitinophaga costaii]PUZ30589.1 aldo/keto reductase [Chitinophaga costaii]SCB72534.1 Predicted oxidoreductase [Chitinophaga costaii]